MRLNLFTRLLILLAVPLTLQLAAIIYFSQVYSKIGDDIHYQMAAMNAVRKVANMTRVMLDFADGLVVGSFQDAKAPSGATLGLFSEMRDSVEGLRGAGEPYPELLECTKAMADEIQSMTNLWTDSVLEGKRPNMQSLEELKVLSRSWNKKTQWLMARPARFVLDQYLRNRTIHDEILIAIAFLILANVVIAALISSIMKRHIVRHVSRLEENVDRLAKNKPLLEPLTGGDEIAQFDQAFHGLVQGVAEARLERQDYLVILNSSMRKPLVELEKFLETVQMDDSSGLTKRGETALTSSSQTIKRLVAMLNELIDFDQIEQGTLSLARRETSALEIIDNAISAVQFRTSESKITIQKNVPEIAFQADPDRLVQVLINLLTNAIKFSPPQSTVEVSAVQNAKDILISVQDQGRGIPADKLDKVFLRFEQVDQADSKRQIGSGLGLAICKTIVEAHGGEIWAENNATQGARFSFTIPRADIQKISDT